MTISLPSKKALFVDVPRGAIQNFSGEFVYNFFMPDEDINDQPQNALPNIVRDLVRSETKNVTLREALKQKKNERYVPRYINLIWDRVPDIGNNPRLIQTVSIANNLDKILDEEKISGQFFTSVTFKDNGSDGKIQYSIKRAMEEILKSQGLSDPSGINGSPLDVVKLLNNFTSDQIQGNFLAEAFINYNVSGINFIDQEKYDDYVKTTTERLQNVSLRSNINNKFINYVLKSGAQQVDNILSDETYDMMPAAQAIQERAIAESRDSTEISVSDYIFSVDNYIDWEPISDLSDTEYQLVGYIIDKKEYPKNNSEIFKETIVIENPAIANFTDLNVKYGTNYGYTIRSIFLVKLIALDDSTGTLGIVSFLVSSQPSAEIRIETKEIRPPNPPTDLNITWDYEKNQPYLTWNFPIDSQRDTKYFQIFKRTTINEPYQLQIMYDFNDSNTPISLGSLNESNIINKSVENLRRPDGSTTPKTFYYDQYFKLEDFAIYSVCSVDAHGQTSNYSTQIGIRFDRNQNRLIKRLISIAGAPKPYPNFYLNQDLFVDSIKTSGSKKLHIYCNPEYMKVFDRAGNDLGLIKTDANSTYKLQLINIDLQKDKIINIKIDKVEDPIPLGNNVQPSVNSRIQVSKLENPDT